MKILYINHYAGSPENGMDFRPYYLAKEWKKIGHKVTIVGASYSHLRVKQPKIKKQFDKEIIGEITYFWIKTPPYKSSGLKRILNMLTFIAKLFKYRKKIIKYVNPEVVIASSTYPLDIYPAFYIAKKNHAKLFFELHDMWPLSPMIIGGYSKYHPFIWIIQKAENFACKKCDYYVSMLSNTKDYLQKHGLDPNKFVFVPNGFSSDEKNVFAEPIPEEYQILLKKLKNERKLIVGYAGGHAPSNALKSLLVAAKELKGNNNISFVLVGSGPQKNELIKFSLNNKLKNVFFLGPIPKVSIPNLLSYFDILYAGGVSSVLHKYGTSSNKIVDYMLARKPIIFSVDEPNSLVETVGCGIQISAEDEVEIRKAIKYISELSQEERTAMGEKGHEYAIKELNYTSLAKKFIGVIDQS